MPRPLCPSVLVVLVLGQKGGGRCGASRGRPGRPLPPPTPSPAALRPSPATGAGTVPTPPARGTWMCGARGHRDIATFVHTTQMELCAGAGPVGAGPLRVPGGGGRCEGRRGIMAENSAPCTAMGAMSARCSTLIPGPSNPQLRALTCPTRPRGVRRDIRRCEGWVSGEGFGVGVGSQQKIAATSQRHTASPTLPTPRSSPQLTHTGFICTGDEGGVRMCRKG